MVEVGVWKARSVPTSPDICRINQNRLVAVDTWKPDLRDPGYVEAATRDINILKIFVNISTVAPYGDGGNSPERFRSRPRPFLRPFD
jgi:hypothetical protein